MLLPTLHPQPAVGPCICPTAGCGFTTTFQVPDDTALAMKIKLLQIHTAAVHNGGGGDTGNFSTTKDDAIEQTKVDRNVHGDSTITATYKAPRNSSTSRSKKSKKRTKFRKSDVYSSGEMATMLC